MQKKHTARKLTAVILTVVIVAALFPAAIFAQAEDPIVKPFYVVNWEYKDGNGKPLTILNYDVLDYVDGMPFTYINTANFNADSESINISVFFDDGTSSSNVNTAAQKLYTEFSSRPAGTRYLNLSAMATTFKHCVKDVVDMEDGVRLVKDWLTRFLDAYQALGGQLDGIAIDLEYTKATTFYVYSEYNKGNTKIYQNIVQNERVYRNRIRPQLEAMAEQGLFTFYTTDMEANGLPADYETNPDSEKSELWNIRQYSNYATSRSSWNQVVQQLLADYITEAVYLPLRDRYPNAVMSDYSSADSAIWYKGMNNQGEQAAFTSNKAGNASSERYYGAGFSSYFFDGTSSADTRTLYYKPAGHYEAVFDPETAYTRALYDVNTQKRYLSSARDATPDNDQDNKVTAWISFFDYASSRGYRSSPYYSELVYHLGMTNPEAFQGYVMLQDTTDRNLDPQDYLETLNDLMTELTRVAGASDREAIVTPITWNDGYILSGMYAGGRNIWRLTPDTSRVSLEDFQVEGTHPTFSANGLTITFPQGRIIEDGPVGYVGTCGYWIETPANVTPVVTSSANRYAENPSFKETFARYTTGAFTDSATSLPNAYHPDTYWTASGTAEIVETTNGKTMALTGTTTLTNDKIPAKITAGDYFANQQVWEVTVTLPASSAYSDITLFKFDDSDTKTNDAVAGIVLSGGQVKYYENSTEQILSNVDISNGGTYTFKRVLDFRTAGAHTSSYYVYNASGQLLGSAENKAIASSAIALPVSKIIVSTTDATCAVVLDDYKLYPLGVTASLDIYGATLGRSLTTNCTSDATARSEKIAYRLSWMNASDAYKKAVVYNSVTGQTIQELLMAPGLDGYITGFVDADAANQVLLAVRQEAVSAPDQPAYSDDFNWPGYAENLGITCIVGSQGYAKLEDALANATDDQAVILLPGAQLESTAVISHSVKILNYGNTISLKDGFSGDCAIKIAAGGQLTWDEGMTINAGNKTALCVSGGTLTVQGGQITAQTGIAVTGGNLTVTGGNIAATDTAILLCQDADKTPASVNVTGGILGGEKALYHCNTNDTPSENVTAAISGATYTGTVETSEAHFVFKTDETGLYLHGHTLSETVLLEQQNAAISSDGVYTEGKYVIQHTCTDCNQSYTEEVPFGAAIMHYLTTGAEGTTNTTRNFNTWHNDSNTGSDYIPHVFMNPGDDPIYFVTANSHATWTDNSYVAMLTDADAIAAGNWQMKLEYPVMGTPVLTLKGANITNNAGLFYGFAGYITSAPLKIVVEEDSTINSNTANSSSASTTEGALNLRTTGDVTITGPGKLTIGSHMYNTSSGILNTLGNLILDHVDIEITKHDTYTSVTTCDGIRAIGDITIQGGSFKLFCYCPQTYTKPDGTTGTLKSYRGINYGIYARKNAAGEGGNVTIKDGADVNITASLSGNQTSSPFGIYGAATVTFQNSDVLVSHGGYAYGKAIGYGENFVVDYTNGFTARAAASNKFTYVAPGSATYPTGTQYTDAAKLTASVLKGYYFSIAHTCQAGEPALEKPANICTPNQHLVTRCTFCGEELAREAVTVEDFDQIHTFSPMVELIEQRVDASITLGDSTGSGWSVNSGKYVFQRTCSVCGETQTEEQSFLPAIFDYLPVTSEGASTQAYNFSTQWADNSKTQHQPRLVVTAGETYYFTTENSHAVFTDNYYVTPLTDEAQIAAGNWNIKLEYPLYGTPVLTLKNAKVINGFGLWYGIYAYKDMAPLTIVLEGNNIISQPGGTAGYSKAGCLNLRTTGDVTITGSGTLSIASRSNTGIIRTLGNLTLDNVTIDIFKHDMTAYNTSYGSTISAAGDIVINGSDIRIIGCANTQSAMYRGIYAYENENGTGGNLIINNSTIFAVGTLHSTGYGMLQAANDIVITESTLTLGNGWLKVDGKDGYTSRHGDAIVYGGTLTVNYANGFNAKYKDTRVKYDPTVDPAAFTFPSSPTTTSDVSALTKTVLGYHYFEIAPKT